MSFSAISRSDIYHLLHECVEEMTEPWTAQLPFPLILINNVHSELESEVLLSTLEVTDICQHIGSRSNAARLYFCTKKYPPPKENEIVSNCKRKRTDKRNICAS